MKKIKSNGLKNRAMKQMTTLIILAMIIMVAVFYGVVHSRTIKNQGRNQAKSLANMEAYLNNYFEEVDAIAKNVNYNYYLQNYLETATDNENAYTDPSVGKNMRAYEMSSQAFSDTLLSRPDISSMMVFGRKKVLLNKSLYSYRNVVMDYSGLEWYQGAIQKPYDMVITGPNRHQFFDTDDETISLSREIQDYEDGTFLGVILINLNMNKITEICDSFQENTSGALGILNESGEAVYLNGDAGNVAVQDIDMKELSDILEQYPENSFRIRLGGTKYLITKERMDSTGWYLLNILPYSWLLSDLWKISMAIVLAVAGTLVVTLLSLDRILTNVIQPLKKLERHMARVTIENMNEQVNITTDDEIGHLAGNFNSMLERIENLKEQVVEEQEDKRRYELQALQAQINPHFLYNSLSIINWKAIEAGEDEISHVTLALSTYYRTSLNRGETMTTVAKEIDNIRAYLKIQLVMHDNEFRVVEQISDGLNDYMIPKLILQPLAENAIDHGIDVSDNEDPTLWLTIREEDKHIFFEIRDNGAGMTQEKADQILTYQSSGYGVRNVCDRIHVLYGEKGEMKIESTPGKGTRVFIRIPKKTEAKVL